MIEAVRAFGYPFRPGAARAWIPALALVLVLPLGLVPLMGYVARAVRASVADPAAGPPSLRPDRRMFSDGLALLLALVLLTVPFALVAPSVYSSILAARVIPSARDAFLDAAYAGLATAFVLLLPWALLLLLFGPANAAAFSVSGRFGDLFSPITAGRRVRAAFAGWNLVTVVVVTAWTIAIAGAGLLCVGFIPAAVYAMLVTAHAISVLVPGDEEAGPA